MKKYLCHLIVAGMFFLAACGGPFTLTPPEPVLTIRQTATSSPLPTATQTSHPTETPTPSITPLPTIPTFTPTFDVSTIVTVTPAPRAECPEIDSAVKIENHLPEKLEYPSPNTTGQILDFLNSGGDGEALILRLEEIYPSGGDYRGGYGFYDVTGDQLPELLFVELEHEGKPVIFSCQNGRYELLATLSGNHDSLEYTFQTDDLNLNGIHEIIVTATAGASFPQCRIYAFEWNGQTFTILMETSISALRQIEIKDIEEDGIKEILFIGDNPVCVSCSNFIPQRQRTMLYGWNGQAFVEESNEFEFPEYRFQAVQDADAAAMIGSYNKAIDLYEAAISDRKLGWWSPERLTYEQHIGNPVYMFVETPSTIPSEDLTEYPRLAAYAYYRIILLHLVQGHESDAGTVYETLQQKFGNDPYGHSYVEMATRFWDAYRVTHKMYDGCAAAIQYAVEHPEILIPLGGDYHGSQSHAYVPGDVCPFR